MDTGLLISRKGYGMTRNFVLETGGVMGGDKVTISAELEAVRMPEHRQVPEAEARK